MSRNIYSFFVASIAVLFAIILLNIKAVENYYAVFDVSEYFLVLFRGTFGFFLGAYIAAFAPWVFTKKEEFFSPLNALLYALCGAVAGIIICFLISILFKVLYPVLLIITPLFFIFLNVRIASKRQQAVIKPFSKRCILALIGFMFLFLPLILSFRGLDFPDNKPKEIRHQWAIRKFGDIYKFAVELINKSPVIRQDVGDDITVAPAVHSLNKIEHKRRGVVADFTINVYGKKGNGICKIKLYQDPEIGNMIKIFRSSFSDEESFLWIFPGKNVSLNDDGQILIGDVIR